MSWWVYLEDDGGDPVEVPRHAEGGTVTVSGVAAAELNVTYNYSETIRASTGWEHSLSTIDGRRAGGTVEALEAAVDELGTDEADDYWADTPGNVGHALSILLDWARQHPDATWRVS